MIAGVVLRTERPPRPPFSSSAPATQVGAAGVQTVLHCLQPPARVMLPPASSEPQARSGKTAEKNASVFCRSRCGRTQAKPHIIPHNLQPNVRPLVSRIASWINPKSCLCRAQVWPVCCFTGMPARGEVEERKQEPAVLPAGGLRANEISSRGSASRSKRGSTLPRLAVVS